MTHTMTFATGEKVRVTSGPCAGRYGTIVEAMGEVYVRVEGEPGQSAAEGGAGGRGGAMFNVAQYDLERCDRHLWWLSWNQNKEEGKPLDSRPVKWPPPDAVLGFWESGFADDYTTVVALVEAPGPAAAQKVIEGAWNPGVGEWRFCNEHDIAKPIGGRFPGPAKKDWNYDRWPWKRS